MTNFKREALLTTTKSIAIFEYEGREFGKIGKAQRIFDLPAFT